MATRGSAFKRESTVVHGLITPDESMTSTIHPKQETDLDSMSFPNQLQAKVQDDPFRSHHGLPFENHSFASGVSEHQRRSASGKMSLELDISRASRLPLLVACSFTSVVISPASPTPHS